MDHFLYKVTNQQIFFDTFLKAKVLAIDDDDDVSNGGGSDCDRCRLNLWIDIDIQEDIEFTKKINVIILQIHWVYLLELWENKTSYLWLKNV